MHLIAQGTGADVDVLQAVANRTEGSGVIELTLDTRIKKFWFIPDPLFPDIEIGNLVKAGLAAFQSTIKAIPGVHLDRNITWTQYDGFGVLRIEARNNPLPVILGPIVATLIPWLIRLRPWIIGLGSLILGWKLFGGPAASGVKSVAKSATTFMLIILAAIVIFVILSGGKGLSGALGSLKGGG